MEVGIDGQESRIAGAAEARTRGEDLAMEYPRCIRIPHLRHSDRILHLRLPEYYFYWEFRSLRADPGDAVSGDRCARVRRTSYAGDLRPSANSERGWSDNRHWLYEDGPREGIKDGREFHFLFCHRIWRPDGDVFCHHVYSPLRVRGSLHTIHRNGGDFRRGRGNVFQLFRHRATPDKAKMGGDSCGITCVRLVSLGSISDHNCIIACWCDAYRILDCLSLLTPSLKRDAGARLA